MTVDANEFYAKASRPNDPKPAPPATNATAAPKTETDAERFYRTAVQITPGMGKAIPDAKAAPTPPTVPTTTPQAATDPAIAARAADLKVLGVEIPSGLDPAQGVAFHDAAIKAHRAAQDAEVAGWEAESRRTIPAHEIAAAERFAATLDADVREVLASTGLGSHPAVVKLAAKLARGAP